MPYIPQEDRTKYEPHIKAIEDILCVLPIEKVAGEFTYIVYRLLKRFNRKFYHRALGMGCLMAALLEIYRQDHAPYENMKGMTHGDVIEPKYTL